MPESYHDKMSAFESALTWVSHHLEGIEAWVGGPAEVVLEGFVIAFWLTFALGFLAMLVGAFIALFNVVAHMVLLLILGARSLGRYAWRCAFGRVEDSTESLEHAMGSVVF